MKNLTWITSALLAFAGCGDNIEATPDGGVDATDIDASPDAPPNSYVAPTAVAIPLSATGHDQLMSVTAGPGGSFYAAGFAAADLAGPRHVVVVKLTAAGALDTTFGGGDGIASTTVEFVGGSDEIDIATQADGKIVVSATVAALVPNVADADDRDIAVLRFETNGDLDATFGLAGVSTIDLNQSIDDAGTLRGRDGVRGLAVGPSDQLFLHAYQRGEGLITGGADPRIDTEFAVARLTAAGVLDLGYGGGDGKHLLDIYSAATHSNATPRGIQVLSDGSVIASGYANAAGIGTVQAVLYRLTPAGAPDTNFATDGLFYEEVLAIQTEIYDVAIHGSSIITAGYGRNAGTKNDWVSMKFDLATGARDLTFGGATLGAVLIDPSGTMLGSNCRNAVGLPSGSTVLIGSTGPNNLPEQDAAFAVLTAAGTLDPAYGDGVHTYALGANGNDQFWGGAVSGGNALIVGWKGGGATPTATINDDAYAIVLAQP